MEQKKVHPCKGGITLTLIQEDEQGNDQYHVFGYPLPNMGGSTPLRMQDNPSTWCTITPLANNKIKVKKTIKATLETPWVTESGALDSMCTMSAVPFDVKLMVSYYKPGQDLSTPAIDLIQSKPLKMTIQRTGNTVITVILYDINDEQYLAGCPLPDPDGKLLLSWVQNSGTSYTPAKINWGREFHWNGNIPITAPAWLTNFAITAMTMGVGEEFDECVGEDVAKMTDLVLGTLGTSKEEVIDKYVLCAEKTNLVDGDDGDSDSGRSDGTEPDVVKDSGFGSGAGNG